MFKIMAFLALIFTVGTALSAAFGGTTGFSSSTLTASIDADDTTIGIASASGFLPNNDVLIIDSEVIKYASIGITTLACGAIAPPCFLNVTRGHEDTKEESHISSTIIYNEGLGTLNTMLGFNVSQSFVSIGDWQSPIPNVGLWATGLVRLMTADYAFLEGGIGQMVSVFGVYILMIGIMGFIFISFIAIARGLLVP